MATMKKFKLMARNRITRKDDTIKEFDDESMFDTYLDEVDREIYEDAMIIENTYPLPTNRKYVPFKTYEKRRVKKDDKRR